MDATTLLYRLINPSWVQAGRVTSQAFRPTPKDDNKLSVYDGDLIRPEAAWQHFTEQRGLASIGIVAVSVAECAEVDFRRVPTQAIFPSTPSSTLLESRIANATNAPKSSDPRARSGDGCLRHPPTDRYHKIMNPPTKGYFCLVQYCPDLARKEVANVGVLLFSPEHGFLEARLEITNRRVNRFFGSHEIHAKHVKLMKEAFMERIHVERKDFTNLEDLCKFVQTRANHIILTPPKAVRVVSPEADLEALYATLVADMAEHEGVALEPAKALAIRKRLDSALSSPDLLPKIRTGIRIQIPLLKKQVEIPFGFQNGRFNLIQPTSFNQAKVSTVRDAACRYAVEGRSLYEHRDSEFGDLQLVVVADFQRTGDEGEEAVSDLFEEYQVKLYTPESLNDLKEEIRQHGKILTT